MPTTASTKLSAPMWYRSTVTYQSPWGAGQVKPPFTVSKSAVLYSASGVMTENYEKTWVRTLDYRAKLAKGTLPMNPYSSIKETRPMVTMTRNHYQIVGNGFTLYSQTRDMAHPPAPRTNIFPAVRMANRLLAKARNASFSAPVFVGEYRETSSLIKSTATRLYVTARHLRRGDIRSAYHTLKLPPPDSSHVKRFNRRHSDSMREAASNEWMAIRYGWTPLLHDVDGAMESLARAVMHEDSADRRISSMLLEARREHLGVRSNTISDVPYRYVWTRDLWSQARGVWYVAPPKGWQPSWAGLDNPFEVAWELLPLSFVADWFLPIGEYISALTLMQTVTHKSYGIGYRIQNADTFEDAAPSDSYYGHGFDAQSTFEAKTFAPQGPPQAGFEGKAKVKLDWAKCLDLIIILRNELRKIDHRSR